jgi:DNA/RNA endonuclease YhcR with UshA esterase domain
MLGGRSNFTAGYTAPPHYVVAAAAAAGLHFAAVADAGIYAAPLAIPDGFTALPAWRWQTDKDTAAIIYDPLPQPELSLEALAAMLAERGSPSQWQGKAGSRLAGAVALDGTNLAPENLASWFARWRATGAPLLPAGNSNPDLPGTVAIAPRYTGLAATAPSPEAVAAALVNHRGWIATAPTLFLTLRGTGGDGQTRWMGDWLPAANAVTLDVHFGDREGQPAGLAIWQDGRPIRQLDLPPADGRWRVEVPAIPGSILVAAATQADGDFAVTSPLMVAPAAGGRVLLNEVLPFPVHDTNRDGNVDGNDEYIELYNPGSLPVALTGWQIRDSKGDADGRAFTFGTGRYIAGGQRLLLWRKETRLNLNNDQDSLRLLDAAGAEQDYVAWGADLPAGRALARLPDGQTWTPSIDLTPELPNTNTGIVNFPARPQRPWQPPRKPPASNPFGDLPPVPTPPPWRGQTGGAPGSVAQAKLAGIKAWAEFQGVVTAPPNLFNGTVYIADMAADGVTAGIGVNVYLRRGDFPELKEGDRVLVRGRFDSFRGEMELVLDSAEQIWKLGEGTALQPLALAPAAIGESVEGRLVTVRGVVAGYQGDSILLRDPDQPDAEPARITVRSSLGWKRPYVVEGEIWQATGLVSQFARAAPWNGNYRILVRYKEDLVRMERAAKR